ncbi:MAG TPA: RDD family protein [Candidatus Limnocylindrales bacterium]|nr:RDD family protein [Candidatus Limnocylindrales bacterium]
MTDARPPEPTPTPPAPPPFGQPPPGSPYAPPPWAAPPGPAPGVAYAGLGIRSVAFMVDFVVVALALVPVGLVVAALGGALSLGPQEQTSVGFGLAGLAFVGYFAGFWVTRGQTPGMIPFDLRLARASDGGPVYLGRALIRVLTLFNLSIPLLFLGVLWAAFDPAKQGWHDKISGTLVVRPVPGWRP